DAGAGARLDDSSQKFGLFGHSGTAPQLEPSRVRIVHQEQKRALILGEVADADVLLVTRIFGKSDGLFVEHAQKARRPAAMLDIRLAGRARGRKEGGVAFADESHDLRGKPLRETAGSSTTGKRVARAAARLLGPHRRREHHFVGLRK